MRVAWLFLFADWPEKNFSGQSEGGISNASGTRSVRVSAQGHSRSCCKLWPMKIPSSRPAAPGSPRMLFGQKSSLLIMRRSKRSVSDFPCSEEYKRTVSQGTSSCAEVMSLVIEDCKSPCDLIRYMFGQFSGFSSSSQPTHVVIGHFRIVLCLFFKARPRAKPFI